MAGLPHGIIKETQHLLVGPVPSIKAEPDESNTHYFHMNTQWQPLKQVGKNMFRYFEWSPALQIRTVLLLIKPLLNASNPADPLANDESEQWKSNKAQAIETARAWTRLYATNNV
ncbi:hypothetical protein EI555_014358 [Monodon monoceros]|uniref:UBC core domain-containing protein n=1 Tax=Monodon monoceros TaxID=40151 RepID=A0A4U1FAX8_MONMO|nr:hypothetical protein EI555_014358 [Monodon monoceros]